MDEPEMRHISERAARSKEIAATIRTLAAEQVLRDGGGYLAQACSGAEVIATLLCRVTATPRRGTPAMPPRFQGVPGSPTPSPNGRSYLGPRTPGGDRLILSPAHYALAWYCGLVAVGRLPVGALNAYGEDGSVLETVAAEYSPGCELTSGSFAQALSQAAGIALARRKRGDTGRVWVLMSDGELQEGQTWEALQFCAFYRLGNLSVVIDANGQQVDGRVVDVMGIEPIEEKVRAFGASCERVDGHDTAALVAAMETSTPNGPLVIIADTNPTTGMPSLRARWPRLHYMRIHSDEERGLLEADVEALRCQGQSVTAA